ncbi:prepilin-type N-terminal cleavage/methylation domain-containing protein [Aureliella helgolandensis]|uniref:Pseudopilin GspJ n=1 Tax=Aureliella helgolandensis TaxID=2527968 RepID=A0A518GGX9_9BACT|nr:prepilin-type N-terminal cleavage/methylation domain-containing protein [Aureliella helgolandensis]QDV27856.1 hypothetical protein Q31a_62490 [Aureliella helgolandensis]
MLRSSNRSSSCRSRAGFTLIEVLIATAVTLLMMVALARIFKDIGDSMQQGRSALQLNNSLRSVAYRVRTDLQNLTITPNPPADGSTGMGYMQYFDGPQTDYSTLLLSSATGANRIGDVDDIFMGTARAGDVWYSGKVPLFVVNGDIPQPDDNNSNGSPDDLENLISVGAQHAEIVMFVEPVVAGSGAYDNPARDMSYLVANQNFFQDNDADGFPDAYRLHYRTLIIRPDLNLPANGLLPANPSEGIFTVGPQGSIRLPDGSTATLPDSICDMYRVHGVCDLSMRRVYNTGDGLTGVTDYVAANSLEDLMNPINRFAHVQLPMPNGLTTMPLLALGAPLGTSPASLVGSSFLHPAYTLLASRAGEDVLGTDLLAFDIKGYDPGALTLLTAIGGNDITLTPNDPGYPTAMGTGATIAGTGEFVDLAWARKIDMHAAALTSLGSSITFPGIAASMNAWSPLSGYSSANFSSGFPFTDALYKSGQVVQSSPTNLPVYQPSYDTWTTRYEGDGALQMEVSGSRGVTSVTLPSSISPNSAIGEGWRRLGGNYVIDAGTDGIDNNYSASINNRGTDDLTEMETSAPFPIPLRGLKVEIRMEDPATRIVKQMSVVQEFVSQ